MLQDYGRKPYFTTTLTYYEGYFVSKISRTQYTTLTVWSDTKETFSDYLTNVVTFYLLSMKNQLPMSKFWGLVNILHVLSAIASLDTLFGTFWKNRLWISCMLSIMLYSYHWTLSPPIVMTPISLYGTVQCLFMSPKLEVLVLFLLPPFFPTHKKLGSLGLFKQAKSAVKYLYGGVVCRSDS